MEEGHPAGTGMIGCRAGPFYWNRTTPFMKHYVIS